jgi:glycosyltransferase involved in cell wall biosynthesis
LLYWLFSKIIKKDIDIMNKLKTYILVGASPNKEKEQQPGGQLTATRLLVEYATLSDIKLHIIDTSENTFPAPSLKKRIFKAIIRVADLKRLVKENRIDGVILFSGPLLSFYEKVLMSSIAKYYGKKSILLIRSGHFMDSSKKSMLIRFLNRYLLRIPNNLVAQGTKWVEFYHEMGVDPSNVKLISNWIKVKDKHEYRENSKKIVFLFAGAMVEKKGVLELFEIIESHYQELKGYTFRFAGEGILFESLKQRKEENHLDNIELLGWRYGSEMMDEYQRADVFILPSHAEGFPNAILEALNYRLPVIATDVGGISDSIRDGYNGYLVDIKDKESLYKSIKKLGESFEVRHHFSKNSEKVLKERHDFYKNCEKVFNLLEKG